MAGKMSSHESIVKPVAQQEEVGLVDRDRPMCSVSPPHSSTAVLLGNPGDVSSYGSSPNSSGGRVSDGWDKVPEWDSLHSLDHVGLKDVLQPVGTIGHKLNNVESEVDDGCTDAQQVEILQSGAHHAGPRCAEPRNTQSQHVHKHYNALQPESVDDKDEGWTRSDNEPPQQVTVDAKAGSDAGSSWLEVQHEAHTDDLDLEESLANELDPAMKEIVDEVDDGPCLGAVDLEELESGVPQHATGFDTGLKEMRVELDIGLAMGSGNPRDAAGLQDAGDLERQQDTDIAVVSVGTAGAILQAVDSPVNDTSAQCDFCPMEVICTALHEFQQAGISYEDDPLLGRQRQVMAASQLKQASSATEQTNLDLFAPNQDAKSRTDNAISPTIHQAERGSLPRHDFTAAAKQDTQLAADRSLHTEAGQRTGCAPLSSTLGQFDARGPLGAYSLAEPHGLHYGKDGSPMTSLSIGLQHVYVSPPRICVPVNTDGVFPPQAPHPNHSPFMPSAVSTSQLAATMSPSCVPTLALHGPNDSLDVPLHSTVLTPISGEHVGGTVRLSTLTPTNATVTSPTPLSHNSSDICTPAQFPTPYTNINPTPFDTTVPSTLAPQTLKSAPFCVPLAATVPHTSAFTQPESAILSPSPTPFGVAVAPITSVVPQPANTSFPGDSGSLQVPDLATCSKLPTQLPKTGDQRTSQSHPNQIPIPPESSNDSTGQGTHDASHWQIVQDDLISALSADLRLATVSPRNIPTHVANKSDVPHAGMTVVCHVNTPRWDPLDAQAPVSAAFDSGTPNLCKFDAAIGRSPPDATQSARGDISTAERADTPSSNVPNKGAGKQAAHGSQRSNVPAIPRLWWLGDDSVEIGGSPLGTSPSTSLNETSISDLTDHLWPWDSFDQSSPRQRLLASVWPKHPSHSTPQPGSKATLCQDVPISTGNSAALQHQPNLVRNDLLGTASQVIKHTQSELTAKPEAECPQRPSLGQEDALGTSIASRIKSVLRGRGSSPTLPAHPTSLGNTFGQTSPGVPETAHVNCHQGKNSAPAHGQRIVTTGACSSPQTGSGTTQSPYPSPRSNKFPQARTSSTPVLPRNPLDFPFERLFFSNPKGKNSIQADVSSADGDNMFPPSLADTKFDNPPRTSNPEDDDDGSYSGPIQKSHTNQNTRLQYTTMSKSPLTTSPNHSARDCEKLEGPAIQHDASDYSIVQDPPAPAPLVHDNIADAADAAGPSGTATSNMRPPALNAPPPVILSSAAAKVLRQLYALDLNGVEATIALIQGLINTPIDSEVVRELVQSCHLCELKMNPSVSTMAGSFRTSPGSYRFIDEDTDLLHTLQEHWSWPVEDSTFLIMLCSDLWDDITLVHGVSKPGQPVQVKDCLSGSADELLTLLQALQLDDVTMSLQDLDELVGTRVLWDVLIQLVDVGCVRVMRSDPIEVRFKEEWLYNCWVLPPSKKQKLWETEDGDVGMTEADWE